MDCHHVRSRYRAEYDLRRKLHWQRDGADWVLLHTLATPRI
jgi:hypothetical protein